MLTRMILNDLFVLLSSQLVYSCPVNMLHKEMGKWLGRN